MKNTNGYKHYVRTVVDHGQEVNGLCGVIKAETMRADMASYAAAGYWTYENTVTGVAWATDNRFRHYNYTPLTY